MEYMTKERDRWDLLALKFYGDPYAYEVLIRENPQHAHLKTLPAGIKLKVPYLIVEEGEEVRPPWSAD